MDRTDRVEALADALTEAAEHRREQNGDACIATLERAVPMAQAADSPTLLNRTRFRLARAHHDFGDPAAMLDAIIPLLDGPNPFSQNTRALGAMEPIARRYQDAFGYGNASVVALWRLWANAQAEQGDPFMASMGHVQMAWQLACAGQLDALANLLDRYLALTPKAFGDGAHRHPLAASTPESLPFVQADLARTALRAGAWALDDRFAWSAAEALEDAMEDSGQLREAEFWFLEPMVYAAERFGWTDTLARYTTPFRMALTELEHPRAPFHSALGRGWLAARAERHDEASTELRRAAELARAAKWGPEWQALALLEAAPSVAISAPDALPDHAASALALIEGFDLQVFDGWAADLRA